ncbi:uncharacterized protein [Typha angustifolia]|uniref:uncharacterized protein n=1 Tax=Typha angustifolia TaxID=59011 RepID=UPI003C2E622D
MAMEALFSFELNDVLRNVAVFLLVQVLVYLILTKSSNIFSKSPMRSLSFKPMRSMSIRRLMASISDVPMDSEDPSPSSLHLRVRSNSSAKYVE